MLLTFPSLIFFVILTDSDATLDFVASVVEYKPAAMDLTTHTPLQYMLKNVRNFRELAFRGKAEVKK